MVEILSATRSHLDGLLKVYANVWTDSVDPINVERVLQNHDHVTQVAIQNSIVVGFVDGFETLSIRRERRWEVDLLAVHGDFQYQGVGSALIQANLAAAKSSGCKITRALIATDNYASQKAFHKNQFEPDETVLSLYMHSQPTNQYATPNKQAHLITVDTINYRGIWVEGEFARQDLRAACYQRSLAKLDVVGCLVAQNDEAKIDLLQEQDFEPTGSWQFWIRPL